MINKFLPQFTANAHEPAELPPHTDHSTIGARPVSDVAPASVAHHLQALTRPTHRWNARLSNCFGGTHYDPRALIYIIQDRDNTSDMQRANAIIALQPMIDEQDARTAVTEALAQETRYSQTAWAAIEALLCHSDKCLILHILYKQLFTDHLSPTMRRPLLGAIQRLATTQDAFASLIDKLCEDDWREPLCSQLLSIVLEVGNKYGVHSAVTQLLIHQEEVQPVLITALQSKISLPHVRAYLIDVFTENRWHSWMGDELPDMLVRQAGQASVCQAILNAINTPRADDLPHQQSSLHNALTLAAEHPGGQQQLALYFLNASADDDLIPTIFELIAPHSTASEVYSCFIEVLRNNQPVHQPYRAAILRNLKIAAENLRACYGMANCFISGRWNAELSQLAFVLLSDIADAEDVTQIYRQITAPRKWSPERISFSDIPIRTTERQQALRGEFPNAQQFFVALFAVEEYQLRGRAVLTPETTTQLRHFRKVSLDYLFSGIRSAAPEHPSERRRWWIWNLETALAPARYGQLAHHRTMRAFTCAYCLEEKAAHEQAQLACCTSSSCKKVCVACAHDSVLQSETNDLHDKCPGGCGAPLAIQDLAALRLPVARVESTAQRLVIGWLEKQKNWLPCASADCMGGACVSSGQTKVSTCLVCDAQIIAGVDRFLIHSLLLGLGPMGNRNTGIVRSLYCCSAPTEKNDGCDHMTCKKCGGESHFCDGPYTNYTSHVADGIQRYRPRYDDALARAGFYEGIPRGRLNDAQVGVIQQRAKDWLRLYYSDETA